MERQSPKSLGRNKERAMIFMNNTKLTTQLFIVFGCEQHHQQQNKELNTQ